MKVILSLLSVLLVLSSCTFYEPEFVRLDDIKMNSFEGKEASFNVQASVRNDNGYAIKVKPSTLDVYVGDDHMGVIHLDKKVKFKRKQVTTVDAPLTATLSDGALLKIMGMMGKSNLEVRLKGQVKAGVWFVSKKFDVDKRKKIDKSILNKLQQ